MVSLATQSPDPAIGDRCPASCSRSTSRLRVEALEERAIPAAISDPVGDSLLTYTGPQLAGMDVVAHEVVVLEDQGRVIFSARMDGSDHRRDLGTPARNRCHADGENPHFVQSLRKLDRKGGMGDRVLSIASRTTIFPLPYFPLSLFSGRSVHAHFFQAANHRSPLPTEPQQTRRSQHIRFTQRSDGVFLKGQAAARSGKPPRNADLPNAMKQASHVGVFACAAKSATSREPGASTFERECDRTGAKTSRIRDTGNAHCLDGEERHRCSQPSHEKH